MSKIRVAHIIGNIYEGGVESCMMNYFSNIDTNKVSFDFFVERDSKVVDKAKIESLGGKVVIIPHYTHFADYMNKMQDLLSKGHYDICHSSMTCLNPFPLYCAKEAGIKIRLAHGHSTDSKQEKLRSLFKNTLRPFSGMFATELISCSKEEGQWLFGKNSSFKIVNNAIDMERFKFNQDSRNRIRKELNLTDSFVIGHIGRFCQTKNHKFMIDLLEKVLPDMPNARLLFVGEGPDEEKVKQYSLEKGLSDYIVFAGSQKRPEDYYCAMDIFVLPSLYEGLGMVALEAQTSGLKCILSDNVPSETGVLSCTKYLPLDVNLWAKEVLGSIQTDRIDGYNQMINTNFNIKSEAVKLLDYYETLIKKENK